MRYSRTFLQLAVSIGAMGAFLACGGDSALAPLDVTGSWAGTTSQDKSILFTVTAAGVTEATFAYRHSGVCTFNATLPIPTSDALAITDRAFTTGKTQIGEAVFLTASGTFTTATSAAGTLLIQDAPCADTLNLTWTATKQ